MDTCFFRTDYKTLYTYIFADSKCFRFDSAKKFDKEMPLLYPNGFRAVDLVSVLMHPNGVEIACDLDGNFNKFTSSLPGSVILSRINSGLQFMYMGQRNLTVNGAECLQFIYVFRKSYLTLEALRKGLE